MYHNFSKFPENFDQVFKFEIPPKAFYCTGTDLSDDWVKLFRTQSHKHIPVAYSRRNFHALRPVLWMQIP